MKTTLTIFALVAFFMVSSCEDKKQAQDTTVIADTTKIDADGNEKLFSKFRKALAALPDKDRIDVFNALSNEMKADLWKDRIEEAITTLPEEEQAVMRELTPQITPAIYTDSGNKPAVERFATWEKTALDVFDNDSMKLYAIVGLLDAPVEKGKAAAPPAKQDDACDCSIPRDFCKFRWPLFTLVCSNPPPCNFTRRGCGPLGMWICDGLCVKKPNPGE